VREKERDDISYIIPKPFAAKSGATHPLDPTHEDILRREGPDK